MTPMPFKPNSSIYVFVCSMTAIYMYLHLKQHDTGAGEIHYSPRRYRTIYWVSCLNILQARMQNIMQGGGGGG